MNELKPEKNVILCLTAGWWCTTYFVMKHALSKGAVLLGQIIFSVKPNTETKPKDKSRTQTVLHDLLPTFFFY